MGVSFDGDTRSAVCGVRCGMRATLPDDLVERVLSFARKDCWRTQRAMRAVCKAWRDRVDERLVEVAFASRALTVHAANSIRRLQRKPSWAAVECAVRHRCCICMKRYVGGFVFCELPVYAHEACVRDKSVATVYLEKGMHERVRDATLQAAFEARGVPPSVVRMHCSGWGSMGSFDYQLVLRAPIPTLPPEASLAGALIGSPAERAFFARVGIEASLVRAAKSEDEALRSSLRRSKAAAIERRRDEAQETRQRVVDAAIAEAGLPAYVARLHSVRSLVEMRSVRPPSKRELLALGERVKLEGAKLSAHVEERLGLWGCDAAAAGLLPPPKELHIRRVLDIDSVVFRARVVRRLLDDPQLSRFRVPAPKDIDRPTLLHDLYATGIPMHQAVLRVTDDGLECHVARRGAPDSAREIPRCVCGNAAPFACLSRQCGRCCILIDCEYHAPRRSGAQIILK